MHSFVSPCYFPLIFQSFSIIFSHLYSSIKCIYFPDNPSESSKPYNPSGVDVSYSTRHVEESWHHLMKSEDTAKFKQIAVCNFDFLLASVSVELIDSNKSLKCVNFTSVRVSFFLYYLFVVYLVSGCYE